MLFAELLVHIEWLLSTKSWEAAALHVRHAAQTVPARAQAQRLRQVVEAAPPDIRLLGEWPHALAWVAYRAADELLLNEVLSGPQARWPAFQAFAASLRPDWHLTLDWAEQGHTDPGLEGAIAARFRAVALAELERPGWTEAFEAAIRRTVGRDRGLVRLEFEYFLIRHGREAAARDVLAAATTDFQGDAWAMTLSLANLGISCLRLNDLPEAERALQRALRVGSAGAGQAHLSTAWRGLGSVYHAQAQLARAEYAHSMAEEKATTPHDRVRAMQSRSRVLRDLGRVNEALALVYEARQHAQLEEGQPHALYGDLAGLRALSGDLAGAQAALALVAPGNREDDWRAAVVQAACLWPTAPEQAVAVLAAAGVARHWARREARVFPEVFAALGTEPFCPAWTCAVNADGPVRARMGQVELPLKATRPEAALLVLLILHGGRVAVESALAGLDLRGRDERARGKTLSRVVRDLSEVLGWPGAVRYEHRVLVLSPEVVWTLNLPDALHAERCCEGRYDPWILGWRDDQLTAEWK